MIPDAIEVHLKRGDRATLEARVRAPTTAQRDVLRARIVLLAADGFSTRAIARQLGTMPRPVSLWRGRYAREGLSGLAERAGRGRKPVYGEETGRRILAQIDQPVPSGYARWTAPLIAEQLGDVHEQQVWRFLRASKIDLSGRKSWCESNDPDFAAKAAEIVGLYMAPPENALVICVDEKPSIQALERAQGYLKLPNGRALSGMSHDYTRNGVTTLFAAFDGATGTVVAAHENRRRRVEFLGFMNEIVAANPNREIHVILDNLNTHKPKNDRWLRRHPNVRLHFTPTRASWLNQVEIWFSILEGQSLQGASFASVAELRDHIDAFIEKYNETAKPFAWTKTKVRQRRFKGRRISQL
jgi:transposase